MFTTYAKATVGGLIALLGSIGVALVDNSITYAEWVAAAVVGLTAFSTVWGTPNKP